MIHPSYIVSVTGFIRNEDDHILMVRSPRRGWELPGGQVETGETLPQALYREVREESGIEMAVESLCGIYTLVQKAMHILTFTGRKTGGCLRTSPESIEVAWLTVEEALQRIESPSMKIRYLDLSAFSGKVVYRAYTSDPFKIIDKL